MIDTHCHLNNDVYKDDYKDIVGTFSENNISKVVCASYSLKSAERAIEISKEFPVVYASAGIHPHYVKDIGEADFDRLEDILNEPQVVALGETGLDYSYEDRDVDAQKRVFLRHLEILEKTSLPLIVHVRDAFKDCIDILRSNKNSVKNRGIIHCYSGSYESAKIFLDLGYYIAFGGAITFKNNTSSAPVIEKLPLDLILTETDCPYLAPQKYRGKRNEPKYMSEVIHKIAEIKRKTYDEIDRITTENAERLFGI